jgi:hypothetical protein
LVTIEREASHAEARYKSGDAPGARRECGALVEDWKKLRGLKDTAILSFKSPGFDIPNEEEIKTLSDKIETEVRGFCSAVEAGKPADASGLKTELAEAESLAQRYAPLADAAGNSQIFVNSPIRAGDSRAPATDKR